MGREGSVTLDFELDQVVVNETVGFHLREVEEVERERGKEREQEEEELERKKDRGKGEQEEGEREGERNEDRQTERVEWRGREFTEAENFVDSLPADQFLNGWPQLLQRYSPHWMVVRKGVRRAQLALKTFYHAGVCLLLAESWKQKTVYKFFLSDTTGKQKAHHGTILIHTHTECRRSQVDSQCTHMPLKSVWCLCNFSGSVNPPGSADCYTY